MTEKPYNIKALRHQDRKGNLTVYKHPHGNVGEEVYLEIVLNGNSRKLEVHKVRTYP